MFAPKQHRNSGPKPAGQKQKRKPFVLQKEGFNATQEMRAKLRPEFRNDTPGKEAENLADQSVSGLENQTVESVPTHPIQTTKAGQELDSENGNAVQEEEVQSKEKDIYDQEAIRLKEFRDIHTIDKFELKKNPDLNKPEIQLKKNPTLNQPEIQLKKNPTLNQPEIQLKKHPTLNQPEIRLKKNPTPNRPEIQLKHKSISSEEVQKVEDEGTNEGSSKSKVFEYAQSIEDIKPDPLLDAEMRASIRYDRNLTSEQKDYFQWDCVLEEFKSLPAHASVSDHYLQRWARKQLKAGWSLGDPIPDLHSYRAEYGEEKVYKVTGKKVPTLYVYWYEGNRSQIRKEIVTNRNYQGFWVYVDSFTGHLSVLQQQNSFSKYYDTHPINTLDIQMLFKMLELRGAPTGIDAEDVTLNSQQLRKAVEKAQDLLFEGDRNIKGYGLLTPETKDAVKVELKNIQIEKEKQFSAKKFKDVDNVTALAKDPPKTNVETGETSKGGVNLRKVPFTPTDVMDNPILKNDVENSLVEHLPFGARMTIQRESVKGKDGKDPGWYFVMAESGNQGYVAKHLVETKLPAPDVSYHHITKGETLLEIARKYYSPDSEDRVGIVESDGEFRNYVLELARYNEKWRGDEAGAVFEYEANSKDPNSWKKTIVREGLRMWIPSSAEMYYLIKNRPEGQVFDNTNWSEESGQWIIDNMPSTIMIEKYLEWWVKIPVEQREKGALKYYKQQLKMYKKLQADWSWLDPYIMPLVPFVPGAGAAVGISFVYDLFISFNIGYFDQLSKSDPKQMVLNAERTLRNLTQLEHYKGVFYGFFQGIKEWGEDFVDIFVSIGDAVSTIVDITTDPNTYVKIAEFTGDAIEYVATNIHQIKKTLADLNFVEVITGMMTGLRATLIKKGKELGRSTAKALSGFAASSPYDQGYSIGKIVGYIVPEIVLAVATSGIFTAIKVGLKAVQVFMKFIKPILKGIKVGLQALKAAAGAAADIVRFISDFIKGILKSVKKGATRFWEKMQDLFEGFEDFLRKKYKTQSASDKTLDYDVEDYTRKNRTRIREEVKKDLDPDYKDGLENIIKAFAIIEMNDALNPSPPAREVALFLNATIDLPKNDKFKSRHISGNLHEIYFNPKKKYTEGSDRETEGTGRFNYDYREVEIIDASGKPIGEFDGIDFSNKTFIEDKSASGFDRVNPRTGLPAQTPIQWATKHIYNKTVVRIENLKNSAVSTRVTKGGSQTIPSLSEIKDFKSLHFNLDGNNPELINAVHEQLTKLRTKYPDWTFTVEFGK